MKTEITIHKITDGAGITKGWAVIRNKSEIVKEFDCPIAASTFAESLVVSE